MCLRSFFLFFFRRGCNRQLEYNGRSSLIRLRISIQSLLAAADFNSGLQMLSKARGCRSGRVLFAGLLLADHLVHVGRPEAVFHCRTDRHLYLWQSRCHGTRFDRRCSRHGSGLLRLLELSGSHVYANVATISRNIIFDVSSVLHRTDYARDFLKLNLKRSDSRVNHIYFFNLADKCVLTDYTRKFDM